MENNSQKKDYKTIRANFIQACNNSDKEGVEKALSLGLHRTNLLFAGNTLFQPSRQERCTITTHAAPFMIALKAWNKHRSKESIQILSNLLPKKLPASLPVARVIFQSEYTPRYHIYAEKESETYTYTLAQFIQYNKDYLEGKKCPTALQPFFTHIKILEQLEARMEKEQPQQVQAPQKKHPAQKTNSGKYPRVRTN